MSNLGTAKFKDFPGFLDWYTALPLKDATTLLQECLPLVDVRNPIRNALDNTLSPNWGLEDSEKLWVSRKEGVCRQVRKLVSFSERFDQPLCVQEWHAGRFAYLHTGNSENGIVVPWPEDHLDFTPVKDYTGMTAAAIRAELGAAGDIGGTALVTADVESKITQKGVQKELDAQMEKLNALKQEMDDAKNARTGALAEMKEQLEQMRAKLEAAQQEMLADLEVKKAEMERVREQMEGQIYLLDSQIYGIRCYAGEVVKFTKIREGKNAPDNEPIVIHQKLRFLDEDLGRLASLYEIQWDKLDLFEDFLKHSPAALDTFAPNERCVVLVRLSKTGKQQGLDDRLPYSNIMKDYEYFHGKTVGIIIRNGENLYLGWTDEDRVHISDDLIISQVIEDTSAAPEFTSDLDRERWEKEQKAEKMRILDGLISRSFIYNILQGVIDNSSILPLPEGVKLNKQSEYVVYSIADKWLADNRFDSFNSIVDRCNERISMGDMVLTVQSLIPECPYGRHYTGAWENPRGRGEKNRTHVCRVSDCTIYPINLIEFDEPVTMLRYEYGQGHVSTVPKKRSNLSPDTKILEEYEERTRHIYVSVAKSESGYWGKAPARANFEVYDYEFINLTYMNSVWLEWVITNKSLGGWSVRNHPVDYTYAIRYLKTALDFIRKREAQEKELLDAIDTSICKDPDWPLRLSEWKLEKGVRDLTEYQAKRFAAAVKKER